MERRQKLACPRSGSPKRNREHPIPGGRTMAVGMRDQESSLRGACAPLSAAAGELSGRRRMAYLVLINLAGILGVLSARRGRLPAVLEPEILDSYRPLDRSARDKPRRARSGGLIPLTQSTAPSFASSSAPTPRDIEPGRSPSGLRTLTASPSWAIRSPRECKLRTNRPSAPDSSAC